MKIKPNAHAKTHLRYHIIFSTKYRRNCLTNIREDVLNIFKEIANKYQFKIFAMEIDRNHIHFLIEFSPKYSISQVVKLFKQISIHKIWEIHEIYLKQFYWKNKKILWTHGYFCSTVGNVDENKIKNYIDNQGNSYWN